jgi:bifunctional DNA primase/polymerase-like protein
VNANLAAALDYGPRRRLGVLSLDGKVPVEPETGRPMRDWPRRATPDGGQIWRWFDGRPYLNVGIVPSGKLVAIDVDRRYGDDDALHDLERELGELPPIPTYSTGDGWRHLFAPPPFEIAREIDGIKVIFKTGQIVMPPSIHPVTGRRYEWWADMALGDMCLADLLATWGEALRVRAPSPPPPRSGTDADGDWLLTRSPREYVRLLAGIEVGRDGKGRCPLPGHAPRRPGGEIDGTPSLHVYESPQRGWYCFGCERGGGIYQFAALVGGCSTPLRGAEFLTVQRALLDLPASDALADLEHRVLSVLDPPLNIDRMPTTPTRAGLSRLRSELGPEKAVTKTPGRGTARPA